MGVIIAACMTLAALCGATTVALQDAVNGVIPGPPTFYQWVLPLDYDGANFTVPKAYGSCGTSWNAQPSSADTPAFYIVALPVSWTNGSRPEPLTRVPALG
jgi:hypothetical protein